MKAQAEALRKAEADVLRAIRAYARVRGVDFGRVEVGSARAKVREGDVLWVEVTYIIHPRDHEDEEDLHHPPPGPRRRGSEGAAG